VGGRNLDDPDARYTAFLVRGTGHYRIERHDPSGAGSEAAASSEWISSPAVRVAQAGAAPRDELAVRVEGDTTRFLVNGTVVDARPSGQVEPYGVAGLRVSGGVSVAVRDLSIGRGDGAAVLGEAEASGPEAPGAR